MKCTNCNAENANDALFCTECGTKFSSPVPEQVPASEDLSATLSDAPADTVTEAAADAADQASDVIDTTVDQVSDSIEDTAGQISDSIDAPSEDDFSVPEDAPSPFAPSSDIPTEPAADAPVVPAFGFQDNTAPAAPEAPAFPNPGFQPQPAFTPVPQPAAPIDNAPVSGEKSGKKFFVPMIIFIILFALAAAGLGVGAYLYMKQKSDLNEKIEERDKTIDKKEDEISDLEEQVSGLTDEKEVLENDKIQLNADVSRLNDDVAKLTKDVETANKEKADFKSLLDETTTQLNGIYDAITKLAPPTDTIFASKNVVILKPGASETINVSKKYSGSFSITSSVNNKLITTQFGADNGWRTDGTIHTNSLTITAGNKAGQSVITFSTTVDTEKFQILVIVVE